MHKLIYHALLGIPTWKQQKHSFIIVSSGLELSFISQNYQNQDKSEFWSFIFSKSGCYIITCNIILRIKKAMRQKMSK